MFVKVGCPKLVLLKFGFFSEQKGFSVAICERLAFLLFGITHQKNSFWVTHFSAGCGVKALNQRTDPLISSWHLPRPAKQLERTSYLKGAKFKSSGTMGWRKVYQGVAFLKVWDNAEQREDGVLVQRTCLLFGWEQVEHECSNNFHPQVMRVRSSTQNELKRVASQQNVRSKVFQILSWSSPFWHRESVMRHKQSLVCISPSTKHHLRWSHLPQAWLPWECCKISLGNKSCWARQTWFTYASNWMQVIIWFWTGLARIMACASWLE